MAGGSPRAGGSVRMPREGEPISVPLRVLVVADIMLRIAVLGVVMPLLYPLHMALKSLNGRCVAKNTTATRSTHRRAGSRHPIPLPPLTHALARSLTRQLIPTHPLPHSLTHPLTRSRSPHV